ncbi:MAG: aminopeptidase P N-terminal domain-containing protein, partial [Planctomycetes bacterium]|nr:aminopeptidase P N-terminal domain-containing protein [Planctomycetota bacterium]
MPSLDFHRRRRAALLASIEHPTLLMAGGFIPRNYPANVFPLRVDSTFLYFFADPEPDSAALFDPATNRVTLFLHERTAEDALWHGPVPSFEEMKTRHGVDEVRPIESLEDSVAEIAASRKVQSLAVPDPQATARAAKITGFPLNLFDAKNGFGPPELVDTVAKLRTCKEPEEIDEMRKTAAVTD